MKQEIDEIQLLTLSDKGLDNLHKWCNEKDYYINRKNFKMPILSIGQMIDFLKENSYSLDIYYSTTQLIIYVWEKKEKVIYQKTFKGKELCDLLWEAVKEVLEKEKK